MLKTIGLRQIQVISLIIILLSLAIINTGNKSTRYSKLLNSSQAVIESWNGMERIKNDFLVNRSNVNLLGDFDYKQNVSNWENQVRDFDILFSLFIRQAEGISLAGFSSSNLPYLAVMWNSTANKLTAILELLKQLEKAGLNDLLFPELVHNYFTYRMTEKIDFDDNILIMNLLNQFSFLDISTKEFFRLMNCYSKTLRHWNRKKLPGH